MTDLLEIKAVRPSTDKIDRVEFHPVQPWLAFVSRSNAVTVWNYESNEVGALLGHAFHERLGRATFKCLQTKQR
jgi:hypothetical protein